MPPRNQAALDFLLNRRSRPAKTLVAPAPTREELAPLLTAAARSPDHGKLEPWRFIVIEQGAMARLADLAEVRGEALGKSEQDIAKGRGQFDLGHLAVAVIEVQTPVDKVPAIEQSYSAGAVCLALLNAALASGWGRTGCPAGSVTTTNSAPRRWGWPVTNASPVSFTSPQKAPSPPERPRPDVSAKTEWVST